MVNAVLCGEVGCGALLGALVFGFLRVLCLAFYLCMFGWALDGVQLEYRLCLASLLGRCCDGNNVGF